MFFDIFSSVLGLIKIYLFKLLFFKRLYINGIIKIKSNFKLLLAKNSKTSFEKNVMIRESFYLRNEKKGEVVIGDNTFINNNAYITCLNKSIIGNDVSIGPNVVIIDHDRDFRKNFKSFISKPIQIGNNVWVGANVTILKGVTIGDNCIIAANTTITKNIESGSIVREKKILLKIM